MQDRYADMLARLKSERESTRQDDHVLLIDGTNLFIRSFAATPAMNQNGEHVGGMTGFLKGLGLVLRTIRPGRCIIVFDGKHGSKKRKAMHSGYKEGRNDITTRLNRAYEFGAAVDEAESFRLQIQRLLEYLDCLPVQLFVIDGVEADDVIAYLATTVLKDSRVTITSTDKDFLQLIDERVSVWNPATKQLMDQAAIAEKYGISSKNFIYYKIMDGDKSDNVPGINGVGPRTIANKLGGLLSEDRRVTFDEMLRYCEENDTKLFLKLDKERDKLILNYSLMDLSSTNEHLPDRLKLQIQDKFMQEEISKLDRIEFIRLLKVDLIANFMLDVLGWLTDSFSMLNRR